MPDELLTREATRVFLRSTGSAHGFQLRVFHFRVVELEDLHFNHDSAVLLPDFQNPASDTGTPQPRITSLAILARTLKEAKANPTRKLLLAAHADTSGGAAYNVTLTDQRGESVLAVLTGDADTWVRVSTAKHKTRDIQMILAWIARDWGWDCDPGGVDDDYGPATRRGVQGFQRRFNLDFSGDLPETGTVEDRTWRGFFRLYQEELTEVADTDVPGLAAMRAGLRWVNDGKKSVGCGESFPIEQPRRNGYRSATNRRVEICFFDAGEEPLLDCQPGPGRCEPRRCEVYNPRMYVPEMIPVDPILPRIVRVRVHLKLLWKDPDGIAHVFPKDLPLKVTYFDNSTEDKTVGDDGNLFFVADRRKTRFTLKYDLADVRYVASGTGNVEQFLAEPDAEREVRDHQFRVWKLPKRWSLGETIWEISDGAWHDPWFALEGAAIAASDTPARMVVDPKWQFVRLELFDRMFGQASHANKRIAPPPLLFEGLNDAPAGEAAERDTEADTRSNWTASDADRERTCQALPWPLQRNENGSANPAAKPDERILLRFKTAPGSYVFSESATVRRIEQPAAAALRPGPGRLKYYDLPALWTSPGYWTRLPGPPAGNGKFWSALTRADVHNSLQRDKPLTFSLDDIVLYDGAGTTPLTATQMPAIFFHSFDKTAPGASDYDLSDHGVYKSGPFNGTQQVYPYSNVTFDGVRYYIKDYPNWVRLVVAQGNLYDVFADRSARDSLGTPAGARAARRWVDAVTTTVTPTNSLNPRPARTDQPFFSIQPFYFLEESAIRSTDVGNGVFNEWTGGTLYPTQPGWGNGRFDMALVRCCNEVNGREHAVNLQYFRFFFDFTTPPPTVNTPALQAAYSQNAVDNILKRWNGPDGAYNPNPAVLRAVDPVTNKLEVKPRWFLQALPLAQAHFQIQVTGIPRAFMQSFDGTAQYSHDSAVPMTTPPNVGWLTAAHECGHGAGNPDDYGETWDDRACSYDLPSFTHNLTADAYSLIPTSLAMMFLNREPLPRYYWHAAEWVRAITTFPMQVEQGPARRYRMPAHPTAPARHYVTWPVWREIGISGIGDQSRGKFDLYVYHLGDPAAGSDPYRDGLVAGHTFDGLAIVLVKMRVTMPAAAISTDITGPMGRALRGINDTFNFKFQCSGDVGPFHFDNCLIHFSPRFLIDTPTPDWDSYLQSLAFTPPFPTATPPFATAAARTAYFNNTVVPGYAAKVAAVETSYPRHFMVTADNTGATSWTAASSLHYRLPATPETDYWKYFGDMLGLGTSGAGTLTTARLQSRIVSRFMTHIGMANV